MGDLVGLILAVTSVAILASAAAVLGAVIAVVRADHEHPVAHRWVSWYSQHAGSRYRH